jgi:hypothetical protein
VLNDAVWESRDIQRRAGQLLQDITEGLKQWGTTTAPDGSTVYAYEVCVRGWILSLLVCWWSRTALLGITSVRTMRKLHDGTTTTGFGGGSRLFRTV